MKRTGMRPLLPLALLLVLPEAPATAGDDPARSLSPFFVVHGGQPATEAFPLKATQVDVTVSGVIAEVLVRQTYENQGTVPINARYVFPASTRASVHGMKMTIADQVIVARIEERQKAAAVFEAARAEGKSASLLEQQRPNVFTMSVANILPRDRVEVELHYTELLVPGEGIYEFVYPAVVGPRYAGRGAGLPGAETWARSPHILPGDAEPAAFDIRVTLATGLPLQEVRCTSHLVDVAYDAGDLAEVRLQRGSGAGGDRDFILQYRLAGERIQSGLLLQQGDAENFFLLMVEPPERIGEADVPPREYVFILDVSGSMDGFPLDTAKLLMSDLLQPLRETDLFNLVLFAGGSNVLASRSQPATDENIQRAIRIVERRRGLGGTELVPALTKALLLPRSEGYSRTIVVVTDGFIEADREVVEIIRQNLHETNFFSFGIGSSVNRFLVEGIARAGLGEPFVVTKPEESAEAARRFRAYVESPLLTDLRVRFQGFDVYDVEPPALPDLFAGRPVVVFGKWRGAPQGDIEVSGAGAQGPHAQTVQVRDSRPLAGEGSLRYLWARARIARLSDFGFGQVDPGVERRITSLGLAYSLLTKNTSFVAVLEQPRLTAQEARDVDQPLPLPRGVSPLAVGFEYAAGSEPALWLLLLLTLAALALRRALA